MHDVQTRVQVILVLTLKNRHHIMSNPSLALMKLGMQCYLYDAKTWRRPPGIWSNTTHYLKCCWRRRVRTFTTPWKFVQKMVHPQRWCHHLKLGANLDSVNQSFCVKWPCNTNFATMNYLLQCLVNVRFLSISLYFAWKCMLWYECTGMWHEGSSCLDLVMSS